MPNVVMFTFSGRHPNVKIQVPYLRRILDEHPNVRLDIWNTARDRLDGIYLQSITGDRIQVRNEHYYSRHLNSIYAHYADDPGLADTLFVKFDDDVVFMQTDRFGEFIDAIDANRGSVVSAAVINNGACTQTQPKLWRKFKAMKIPLLNVHLSPEFAAHAHNYFFANWTEILDQPVKVIDTEDWLSINMIGMDWKTLRAMTIPLDSPSPAFIAGREFTPEVILGDEGSANLLPRKICKGFTACHLTFRPQDQTVPMPTIMEWRDSYAKIAQEYLAGIRVS